MLNDERQTYLHRRVVHALAQAETGDLRGAVLAIADVLNELILELGSGEEDGEEDHGYTRYETKHSCGHVAVVYAPPELKDKFVGYAESNACPLCVAKKDAS